MLDSARRTGTLLRMGGVAGREPWAGGSFRDGGRRAGSVVGAAGSTFALGPVL